MCAENYPVFFSVFESKMVIKYDKTMSEKISNSREANFNLIHGFKNSRRGLIRHDSVRSQV